MDVFCGTMIGVVDMNADKEKIDAVQRMQDYIVNHYTEEISLKALASAAAYSPWQALRAFRELTGKTPFAYIRDVRLSDAARRLRDSDMSVLGVALSCAFGSHEGFTKAFSRKFGLAPNRYRKEAPPVPLFTYYPVKDYFKYLEGGINVMRSQIIFTQAIERPARKLLFKSGIKAAEYFEYCEEVGCDIWGVLVSVKGALNEPMGVWLPEKMRKAGTSEYAQGVEVPPDYAGLIPEGFNLLELPPCKYMVFQGEPYEDENFAEAIALVWDAIARYDPKPYGWDWAPDDGPRFQLEPQGARGYIEGRPVR